MTEPLSRRSALALGGIGAALVIAGGTGIVWTVATIGSSAPLRSGKELTQPTPLRSIDGLLNVALVAGPSTMMIGGTAVKAMTYNGALPGPTLIVRAGTPTDSTSRRTDRATMSSDGSIPAAPQSTDTRSRRTIHPGSSGTTRTTMGWRQTRFSAACTAPSSWKTRPPFRRPASGCSSSRT
jgi:hypothetical protein